MELDAILKGETPPEETEAQKAERLRDDKGRFAKGEEQARPEPTQEVKATPPAAQTPKEPTSEPKASAFQTAMMEERRKRQELERKLEELQRQPPPNPAQQPAEYHQYMHQQVQTQLVNERMNLSEAMVREKHGDEAVDEALAAFTAAVEKDPTLQMKVLSERNPYGWLVKWNKTQKHMQEVGDDPDSYRSKLESELRQKLEAEYAQKYQRPAVQAPPPSLASATSSAVPTAQDWAGPTPLNSILKRK